MTLTPPPAPEPQKVEAPKGAIEKAIHTLEWTSDVPNKTIGDAREEHARLLAERAALAARVADLELMLRAAFPDDSETAPFMTYGLSCTDETTYWVHRNADDADPISLPDDGTGLPALSAPAREALRRTK